LRFNKKKSELAGPREEQSSHYDLRDIDSFAMRKEPNFTDMLDPTDEKYQIISVSPD